MNTDNELKRSHQGLACVPWATSAAPATSSGRLAPHGSHVMHRWKRVLILNLLSLSLCAGETFTPYRHVEEVPQNVTDLWQDYDPRSEDLDVKVIRQWQDAGVVTRYVTFKVGTFKGVDARIAAYYSFPDHPEKTAAFVWCHGGGQRAERLRGIHFAQQGFATVDINWLGRPMEKDIAENTDWGNVDPTQGPRFYAKALREGWKRNLKPDEHSIDPVSSPRNNNWFLLVVAARRAITFLERQPEVDPDRIGMAGFSMGGTVTAMAAMDTRLKAVVPFVGGTGFMAEDFPGGLEGTSIRQHLGNLPLYRQTVDPSAYWPLVNCPVMFISSSNDFHAAFERIFKSMALLPHRDWRVSTNIHENHRPGPEQWVLLTQWFDLHLAGMAQAIPATPPATLDVNGKTARFTVTPEDREDRRVNTDIYYSYDTNARTRFWNRAAAVQSGTSWRARVPIHEHLPLYMFATCRYALGREVETLQGSTSTLTVNSLEYSIVPEKIDLKVLANMQRQQAVFEDFEEGLQDWAVREEGRQISTYKFQNPAYAISNDKKLLLRIDPRGRRLSIRLRADSRFLSQGLDQGSFSLARSVQGNGPQDVMIDRRDFTGNDGKALQWSRITRFYLSIVDEDSKAKIDLTAKEGRGVLKMISLVDE